MSLTISDKGVALIKQFESCAEKQSDGTYRAYPDPRTKADPYTIGWGSTGPGIVKGTIWTQAQCDAALAKRLQQLTTSLNAALGGAKTSQGQFDALASLAYNIGMANLKGSRLFALHCAGKYAAASLHFPSWAKAGGKMMPGLVRRREAEAALYVGGAK